MGLMGIKAKVSYVYQLKPISIGISFVLALLFSVLVLTTCNPIWDYTGVDSAAFILLGKGILTGHIPYVDLADNKGLILHFLEALPQALSPNPYDDASRFFIWIEELIFLFASLRIIVRITRQFGLKPDILPQVVYLICIMPLVEGGNLGEEYANFFIWISFAAFLNFCFREKCQPRWRYGFILGILFALAFFIKPNNAAPIAAVGLISLTALALKKDTKRLLLLIMNGIFGFSLILLIILAYLIPNGALNDFISFAFTGNLAYSSVSTASILELFRSPFGCFALLLVGSSLLCLSVAWTNTRNSSVRLFIIGIGCASVLSFFFSLTSMREYLHYLLICAAPFTVSIILLLATHLSVTSKHRSKLIPDGPAMYKYKYPLCIISVLFLLLFASPSIVKSTGILQHTGEAIDQYIAVNVEQREGIANKHTEISNLVSMIPESDRDSVYVVDPAESLDVNDFYVQAGVFPAFKVYFDHSFRNYIPGLNEEYQKFMRETPPKWLVSLSALNDANSKKLVADGILPEELLRRYTYVGNNSYDMYLYALDGCFF
jgi:hypothetical protein